MKHACIKYIIEKYHQKIRHQKLNFHDVIPLTVFWLYESCLPNRIMVYGNFAQNSTNHV